MKIITVLTGIVIAVIAGVLLWHLSWMQEMSNKYDVNQLWEEGKQLDGQSRNLPRNVSEKSEQSAQVNNKEDKIIKDMQDAPQEEPITNYVPETKVEATADVVSRPESVAEIKSETIVPKEENIDVDGPVEKVEIINKDTNYIKPAGNQPLVITIKGKSDTKTSSTSQAAPTYSKAKTRTKPIPSPENKPPVIHPPVTQHPTSTAP